MTEQMFSPGDADFSMWDDTSNEIVAVRQEQTANLAMAAVQPLWPFLSAATTRVEFEHRMGMVEGGIASRVAAVLANDVVAVKAARDHLRARWAEVESDITANTLRTAAAGHKIAGDGQTAEVMAFPLCQFCKVKDATYDGKTVMGPWAYMCDEDFKTYGLGTGLGQGQKLVLAPSSKTSASVVHKAVSASIGKDLYCGSKTGADSWEWGDVTCPSCLSKKKTSAYTPVRLNEQFSKGETVDMLVKSTNGLTGEVTGPSRWYRGVSFMGADSYGAHIIEYGDGPGRGQDNQVPREIPLSDIETIVRAIPGQGQAGWETFMSGSLHTGAYSDEDKAKIMGPKGTEVTFEQAKDILTKAAQTGINPRVYGLAHSQFVSLGSVETLEKFKPSLELIWVSRAGVEDFVSRASRRTALHATDIVGYTYRAEIYCPGCIIGQVTANPGDMGHSGPNPDTNSGRSEPILDVAARIKGIDRQDESSFDTDDFPKVIFASDAQGEHCGLCGMDLLSGEGGRISSRRTAATEQDLQRIADFDHPFTVHPDGSLTDAPGVYAPSVYHDPKNDIEIESGDWEALTGFTGQYSYNGAVMHSSEYLGGGLAQHILSTPGTYVVTSVEVHPEDAEPGEDPDQGLEPAGWAVLRYKGKTASRRTASIDGTKKGEIPLGAFAREALKWGPGHWTFTINGVPLTLYWDSQQAYGDDNQPVRGDTTGELTLHAMTRDDDDVVGLVDIARMHISPRAGRADPNETAWYSLGIVAEKLARFMQWHERTTADGKASWEKWRTNKQKDMLKGWASLHTAGEATEHAQRFADGLNAKHGNDGPWPGYHTFHVNPGKKMDKIVQTHAQPDGSHPEHSGSVHAFVDRETGQVYKPAGWNAPAKGARYPSVDEALKHSDPHGGYLYAGRGGTTSSLRKGAPFAGYEDFEACVRANSDKDDPEAYCGKIKHQVEDGKKSSLRGPAVAALLAEAADQTHSFCFHCRQQIRRTAPDFTGTWVSDDGNYDMCPANPPTFDHEPLGEGYRLGAGQHTPEDDEGRRRQEQEDYDDEWRDQPGAIQSSKQSAFQPGTSKTKVQQEGNKWQGRYYDADMGLWFDLGDPRDSEEEARELVKQFNQKTSAVQALLAEADFDYEMPKPTNSWKCEKCGHQVDRYRGESNVTCPNCGAEYNSGGQRLRDDWRNNMSNYDDDIGDMEGYEDSFHDASRRQAANDQWTCSECGHQNSADDDRCVDCGAYAAADYDEGVHGSHRQAVNEDAYGTERYQHVDVPGRASWITEWADAEMRATKEMTEEGYNAYVKPNPFPGLTTLRDVRTAALKMAGEDDVSEVGEIPETGENAATGEDSGSSQQAFTTKPAQVPGGDRPNMVTIDEQIIPPPGMGTGLDMATQPADASTQMGSGGGFDMGYGQGDPMVPTAEQMVAAKTARLTARIQMDNPTMAAGEAKRLAALTIAKHPEMVAIKGADQQR